ISLRVLEFAPGVSPLICNDDCDEILYVLDPVCGLKNEVNNIRRDGHVKFFINECSCEVGSDSGIYIRPGETFGMYNAGPDFVTVISVQCPDPNRKPQFVETPSKTKSSGELPVVRLADQKAQPTADRWYRVLIDERVGSTQVTQFVGSIPRGRAPDHFHQYEEVLFILKGEGRMWAGENNTPIAVGSCIYLPKGQVHCVENTSEGELRLLGVFYPAGSPSVRY